MIIKAPRDTSTAVYSKTSHFLLHKLKILIPPIIYSRVKNGIFSDENLYGQNETDQGRMACEIKSFGQTLGSL